MLHFLRAASQSARLLVVMALVAAVCCGGGCRAASLEYTCTSDAVVRGNGKLKSAPVVVKSVPAPGEPQSGEYVAVAEGWAPIRIAVSTGDLENTRKYCSFSRGSKPNLLGDASADCRFDELPSWKKKLLVGGVVPAAVKLHAERLLVQPLKGPLKVPEFAADSVCGQFTVPAAHRSPGVDSADMVLYVAAAPGGVWALPCATLENGRPIVGAVNLAPANLFHGRLATRIAAHEIAHALGFSYQQMAAHRMLRNVTGVRGRKLSVVVNSTNAAMAAREHYDCDNIRG
ncbi:surface protease GP63, partial [Trypanosoma conorhini]